MADECSIHNFRCVRQTSLLRKEVNAVKFSLLIFEHVALKDRTAQTSSEMERFCCLTQKIGNIECVIDTFVIKSRAHICFIIQKHMLDREKAVRTQAQRAENSDISCGTKQVTVTGLIIILEYFH